MRAIWFWSSGIPGAGELNFSRAFSSVPRFIQSLSICQCISLAQDAFGAFGKGKGHPAKLNFGDCMSYAVAKFHDVPLLFKGDDFRLTDIRAAL